jgi:uncharacterized protein
MRKILLIIFVIILFIASGFIFWAGLAPVSFNKFFVNYPQTRNIIKRVTISNNNATYVADGTSSEPVLGTRGQIIIKNNVWDVEIANTDASRVSGLSNRKALYNKKGMLFVFEDMNTQTFWMKDMLIPIDMIFFDNEWKIVLVESDLQPNTFPNTFGGGVKSQYIMEVNAGESLIYGLEVGDTAIFLNK